MLHGLFFNKKELEKYFEQWITEHILLPWKGGIDDKVLPLTAVDQTT